MTAEPPAEAPTRRPWGLDEAGTVVSGLVLFGLAWLPWYKARVGAGVLSLRGWDLGLVAVVAVLASLYAAGRVAWLRGHPLGSEVPVSPAAEPFLASFVALVLLCYRALDVPTIPDAAAERDVGLSLALAAVVLQAVFAARAVARTGFRA